MAGADRSGLTPEPGWPFWLARLGGAVAGFGVARLVYVVLEGRATRGIPANRFFFAGLGCVVGFALLRRAARTPARSLARSTLGTAAGLLIAFSVIMWEGHAGGYYAMSRMSYALYTLENLEDGIRERSGSYSETVPPGFALPDRVVDFHYNLTDDGWTASVRHAELGRRCAIFVGSTPLPPATVERRFRCTRGPLSRGKLTGALALIAIGVVVGSLGRRGRES